MRAFGLLDPAPSLVEVSKRIGILTIRFPACFFLFRFHRAMVLAALALVLVTGGCATPVGVRYLDAKQVQRTLTANVLSSDDVSAPTAQILNRAGLGKKFQSEPAEVLAMLHRGLPTASETDRLFALSELSFAYASRNGPRQYYFASAIYAYAFLFPADGRTPPDQSDPRIRVALDLYNRGTAQAFATGDKSEVVIRDGIYRLPFGEIVITTNPDEFRWGFYRLVDFVQAAELEVRGLRNRYRWPGIGAPLAAAIESIESVDIPRHFLVPPNLKVAVTAFLRLEDLDEGLKSGNLRGRMELYTAGEATSVTINGCTVPLEYEMSSALAYTLEGSQVYDIELKALFSGDFQVIQDKSRFQDNLFFMEPYRPGYIPVVLVHGTASSPARWAELLNELQNDPEIRQHYQFWLFTYNTGNPILYSAGILTDALNRVVNELDPDGKDPALRKMVVIGHSQGGLLTRLTASDSGARFWDNAASVPFEKLEASPETKQILRRSMFFKPLPSVKRVVFIATPHKGSFVAGGWIGRLTGKLISLPFRILNPLKEVVERNPNAVALRSIKNIPRSTDQMDPKSPFIRTLDSIPIASNVTAHSIIAVKNPHAPKEEWTDGVVDYSSAHIDGVASELVVHSGHSTQSEPETIEEVRRILIEHLKEEND
jgi:pimeloyl-ACP methyl ester carboxylesterase